MKHIVFSIFISFSLFNVKKIRDTVYLRSSGVSGIGFSNVITSSDSTSVLDSEYLYNGGGVAVGDINNDGLLDLYFTGNMVSSQLYLNKGNLKFEDVTEKAKVGTTTWANGASMVDINQDGHTDIYVCVGGTRKTPEKDRANLLLLITVTAPSRSRRSNTALLIQDMESIALSLTMTATEISTCTCFGTRLLITIGTGRNQKSINGEAESTDKLFRNNGDLTFTDVPREAGILIEGFGLGVVVSDLNDDGWPDVYAANDFITNDLMYINNQDGTFTNRAAQYLKASNLQQYG